MSFNLYYNPEKFAVETIGEIEWGHCGYSHDLTVVWKRKFDGFFVYGDDSGCSCSLAYSTFGLEDLTVLKKRGGLNQFKAYCEARNAKQEAICNPDRQGAIVALLERMHAAGAR